MRLKRTGLMNFVSPGSNRPRVRKQKMNQKKAHSDMAERGNGWCMHCIHAEKDGVADEDHTHSRIQTQTQTKRDDEWKEEEKLGKKERRENGEKNDTMFSHFIFQIFYFVRWIVFFHVVDGVVKAVRCPTMLRSTGRRLRCNPACASLRMSGKKR